MSILSLHSARVRQVSPPCTRADLLASARLYAEPSTGPHDFEDFIEELPGLLHGLLDIGLDNFDYHRHQRSPQAILLRCIASMVVRMENIARAERTKYFEGVVQ
jgi:hypothetical protein